MLGSSPHSRGTPKYCMARDTETRIIPAFAGNTHEYKKQAAWAEDHPRIRGEHFSVSAFLRQYQGSSPHSRGTQEGSKRGSRKRRIIPAFAGNTKPVDFCHSGIEDHPRIRGEHRRKEPATKETSGSSPHSRGTHPLLAVVGKQDGIIPAFAGNTPKPHITQFLGKDHPRIRGEHWLSLRHKSHRLGSSPHSRGTPHIRSPPSRSCRIIPAFAGNTHCGKILGFRNGDHPRIRGEHFLAISAQYFALGSSPHSRGTPGSGS